MKRLLSAYVFEALSTFRWFRKKKGGKWYLLDFNCTETGFAGRISGWSKNITMGTTVIKEEDYG